MIRRRRKTIDGLLEEYGERGGRMNVFQENHLSGMDHMAKQMDAIVELKTMENLRTNFKDVSSQMEKKQEEIRTIAAEIFEMKLKLHDEFQVEECSFFSISSADGFAVKMYKSRLREMTQQKTGLDDDLLDLEQQKKKMVKDLEEKELEYSEYIRMSKKRLPVKEIFVPTSVRKQRRGEGGWHEKGNLGMTKGNLAKHG
jgi:hypothetical protein